MKKSKRRARRTSKQRASAPKLPSVAPERAFTDTEEAFFAAGVAASESGEFEGVSDEAAPRPGLFGRLLSRS